jgi:hypothetical protein
MMAFFPGVTHRDQCINSAGASTVNSTTPGCGLTYVLHGREDAITVGCASRRIGGESARLVGVVVRLVGVSYSRADAPG